MTSTPNRLNKSTAANLLRINRKTIQRKVPVTDNEDDSIFSFEVTIEASLKKIIALEASSIKTAEEDAHEMFESEWNESGTYKQKTLKIKQKQ